MVRAPLTWIAVAALGITLLLAIAAVVLALMARSSGVIPGAALLNDALAAVTSVPFALVGAVILSRRANAIGAILLGFGVIGALLGASSSYGAVVGTIPSPTHDPRPISAFLAAGWFTVIGAFAWLAGITLVALLVQLFPEGRPLSPRWRALTWLTLAFPVVLLIVTELSLEPDATGHPAHPLGETGPLADGLAFLRDSLGAVFIVLALLSFFTTILRFRRSVGRERAQLEWFAYGVALAAGINALTGPLGQVGYIINDVAATSIAATIGIAILRHRLYDIDLLIRRTVSYGVTSAALALTFFSAIVVLEAVLRPLTAGSEAAVAISTLVAVALFQPIRRGVQDAVDRRFDRSRYDAARTVDAFAVALRDEVDLESVRADLIGAVAQTVAPDHASLWLRGPSR
jgi:hypothetical protein